MRQNEKEMGLTMATRNKMDVRLEFVHHPNPRRIIEEHYNDYFKYNENESLYWNIINFLEYVRVNNLWDSLIEIMEK